MTDIIKLNGIEKYYGFKSNRVVALSGVNLTIKEGEFLALVGKSGCGKTTLLNILGGLDIPDKGTYVCDENDITSYSPSQLAKFRKNYIGFVVQHFALIPNYTVFDNIALPLRYKNMDKTDIKNRVMELLNDFDLETRAHAYPNELSGGQSQRVAIARAIASRPPIILADEPTGELDSKTTRQILEILRKLNEQGHTIIMVTHDLEVSNYCERTLSMSDGFLTNY